MTGGPGSGKTTTLEVLRSRGFTCLPDVARTVIRHRLESGLGPRPEAPEFARSLLAANIEQYDQAPDLGKPLFFDFSIVESVLMMRESELLTDEEVLEHLRLRPYNRSAFFFPPWEAIYAQDKERDQSFTDAVRISHSIRESFESLGFRLVSVPCVSAEERADTILITVDSAAEP